MDCSTPSSLSFPISWSLLQLVYIDSVMISNHLILCCPFFLLPSIFPSIRVFSNESVLCIRWSKYWSFSFSISSSNECEHESRSVKCWTLCDPMDYILSWNSSGQNNGVGSLPLLQGIFPTQGLKPGLHHCRQILYQLSHKRSPRIQKWVSQSVQSLSRVWLFVTPWTAAHQASLSTTNSRNLLKLMSIQPVMPSNHLILCHPLLLLPLIFPDIRVFSNELALRIR